jgi:hypothetical protein
MMMCDDVPLISVLKSCALASCINNVIYYLLLPHSYYIVVLFPLHNSGLAARRRQELTTLWASWTRRCSCTWITGAMAHHTKNKGVSHGFLHTVCASQTKFQLQFPPALHGQTHPSCD